jgi:prophage regulatory protein
MRSLFMRLIRLKDVKHATGLGRSTIYKYIEEGIFPKSVSLGERAVAWVESEVMGWVMARIEARDVHESFAAQPQRRSV